MYAISVGWQPSWKQVWVIMLAILILAGSVRVISIEFGPKEQESDAADYWNMAMCVYDGTVMRDTIGNYAFMSPGYPLLLGGIWKIFGASLSIALYVNLFLGLLGIVLLYILGSIWHSKLVGIIASGFWAVYAPAIMYTSYLNKETLMVVLLLLQMILLLQFIKLFIGNFEKKTGYILDSSYIESSDLVCAQQRSCVELVEMPSMWPNKMFCAKSRIILSYGVISGLHLLVGTASAVFPLLAVIIIAWLPIKIWKKLGYIVLLFGAIFFTISPWLYRNYRVIGHPVLVTNGGFNLLIGNNHKAGALGVSLCYTNHFDEFNQIRIRDGEYIAEQAAKKWAMEYIWQNPWKSILLAIEKLLIFWAPPLHMGKEYHALLEDLARAIWFAEYILIIVTAIASIYFFRPGNSISTVLWLNILLYNALHMIFYVIFRYRLPIMPLVILLSSAFLVSLEEKLRHSSSTGNLSQGKLEKFTCNSQT